MTRVRASDPEPAPEQPAARVRRAIALMRARAAALRRRRPVLTALVPILVCALALVLADALFEHAGGNSVGEMRRNLESYLNRVEERLCPND